MGSPVDPRAYSKADLIMKHSPRDRSRSRLLFCAAAFLVALLAADSSTRATAQAADAEERCTGDVMRLCSEFTPDVDPIVICLKAKRLQLSSSCLNALLPLQPQPLTAQAPATKATQKTPRAISPAEASRSTRIHAAAR